MKNNISDERGILCKTIIHNKKIWQFKKADAFPTPNCMIEKMVDITDHYCNNQSTLSGSTNS